TRAILPYRFDFSSIQRSSVCLSPNERIILDVVKSCCRVESLRPASTHTQGASACRFVAMKILLLRGRARDFPFGFDHCHSFRGVPSDRRQFPPELFQFAALHWPRNLPADYTRGS